MEEGDELKYRNCGWRGPTGDIAESNCGVLVTISPQILHSSFTIEEHTENNFKNIPTYSLEARMRKAFMALIWAVFLTLGMSCSSSSSSDYPSLNVKCGSEPCVK